MGVATRITPEQVIEAYRETGINPSFRKWATIDPGDNPCGCGLTAMYLAKLENQNDIEQEIRALMDDEDEGVDLSEKYADALNLDTAYTNGFVGGFDARETSPEAPPVFMEGYSDGVAARKEIERRGWEWAK